MQCNELRRPGYPGMLAFTLLNPKGLVLDRWGLTTWLLRTSRRSLQASCFLIGRQHGNPAVLVSATASGGDSVADTKRANHLARQAPHEFSTLRTESRGTLPCSRCHPFRARSTADRVDTQ